MRFRFLVFAVLLLVPSLAHAQAASVRGKLLDAITRGAVGGVQVKLTSFADTADVHRATARDDGTFTVTGLGLHAYRLEVSRLGYEPLKQVIRVNKSDQDLGVLTMIPKSVNVPGVTVTESALPATQKADTTEFRAGAVKIGRDATAEDLVQKLPGVTVENGQVKAQGENVQNVLVNGRPFFGSDPTAALRNLPAEVVDRIQVYDRASDQAEFSGFDDGQQQRTMNFILRDQKAKFGKVYGGYGDQDRYQAGGNVTLLRGPSRVTLLGMSNNINQRNFSPQDLFGALSGNAGGGGPRIMMMGGGMGGHRAMGPGGGNMQIIRMGGGGFGGGAFDPSNFFIGQQAGVSTTHSGGANVVHQWSPRLTLTGSLFVSEADNRNDQALTRQYLPVQDSLAFYDQGSRSDNRNGNQRLEGRLEWSPDSANSFVVAPRLFFQSIGQGSRGTAANTSELGTLLNAADSRTWDANEGYNLSNRVTLRHRFAKRGRNVSADVNVGRNLRDATSEQYSLTESYGTTTTRDTLDLTGDARSVTNSFSTRVAFTEPLNPSLQAQLIWNPSWTRSTSDSRMNQYDVLTGRYATLDSAQSNSYENRNTVQNGGLAMLYTKGPWKLLGNLSAEQRRLESDQTFPALRSIDQTFGSVLPSATLTGNLANRRTLRLAWNTSTAAPSISQLQNVVNRSNPLSVSTGNPDLRPTYAHSLSLRWSEADPMRSRSRFVFANVTRTSHPIANATLVATRDTVLEGVSLTRGTQLTRPENVDEPSWNANLFGVVSRPMPFLKSVLSVNGGASHTRTPTLVNQALNVSRTTAIRGGSVLASNISQNLDFTLTYQGTWNISRSTLDTSDRGDYYTHSIGLRFNSVIGPGIVFRQELNHNLQSRVPQSYGQDVVLWNSTLGKKFLKDGRGELRVTATDVLEQNRSVSRNVTETYVQDSRDQVLGRYVQAVFTYSFR